MNDVVVHSESPLKLNNVSLNESKLLDSDFMIVLSSIGCCKICALRFCGETNKNAYQNHMKYENDKRYEKNMDGEFVHSENLSSGNNGTKVVARNPCVACLGVLQPPMSDKIIDEIVGAVSRDDYDNPTFGVAFTLPVSFYLRAHSLLVFLVNNYPEYVKEKLPMGLVTVGVKDAWKYVYADKVAERINKRFNADSELKFQVDIQYEDDHHEISCLHEIYPQTFKESKIKSRKLRHLKGPNMMMYSRKTVESILSLKDRDHFAKFYPVPPAIPSNFATCNNVLFDQCSIFIGGRYNKYVRGLPQTAWLVQNERKLETSVHELIGDKVQAFTKAQGSKLVSSGREDVDVRMLGSGRPFALELLSPRHVVLSETELEELQRKINEESRGRVEVGRLKLVTKADLEMLKSGEEKKTKTYRAWCVARGGDQSLLGGLSQLAPLQLQQRTPVRVLHRRPIATRPRTVHWMNVSDITPSPDLDTVHFALTLNTQAGTYIKEFVHGDFGRTKPSLGELLGGASADCLALDVQSIDLEWPPP